MASQTWLESSLRRSYELGQEVLEKAKRRSVSSSSTKSRPTLGFCHKERGSEGDTCHSNLNHAFATIVEYMSETTRQCKKYYTSVHRTQPSEQEHICRYHSQQTLKTADQKHNATAATKQYAGLSEAEDFLIEVSPGTYSITAAMQDTRPQTKTVHVDAGESMSLAFNL
ncbi:A-kinase-interacting protein 1 isoform X1 [Danio rerio]|uniref:A kinase (PRKA)-interacting protein 1 n=1 Tax=Danio rerio TaxID=7955 RepID=Q1L8C6_DANRE|nr:A-kinase-interacting protein 1 [Danio rerio]XP_005159167.1 A-kinase-interacting protein 1 isoform X1 [Danio rerio]|eukprot:NP_001038448.1 A-kinase-interacting protein 1 [Danio rerio]